MPQRKYLVTGAAGFMGSAVAKQLIENGHEVWTIDNLRTGSKENLPDGIHFIEGGCQDPKSIDALQKTRFDAIFHIAGQSSGEISFEDPVYDLRTNTESTLRLIQYGLRVGCTRFIYASSMSVYGATPDQPVTEDHSTQPLSFYGVGKIASEHYMRIYESKGLRPTSLRLCNIYGPNQNMNNLKQGMVSIYLAQLIKNDKIIVKGSKDRYRDFICIHDVVDFCLRIVDDPKSYGGIYNLGTGIRTTVEELLNLLLSISGIKKEIAFSEGTPGDQKGVYGDVSLIKDTFGFECQYDLKKGLKEMIEWAQKLNW